MKKEFRAKSVEEAKAAAAAEFGVDEDKITFEIVEEPKKGFLGIGSAEAIVSAEYNKSKAEIAADYVRGILKEMDVDAELEIIENEDGSGALINIKGDTTGTIIGRRGETLDAVQYLASMAANRGDKEYYRIMLDSCGYREKRKTILEELAGKIARTVLRTGRTSTLEPMNPYERRIIHSAISAIEGVSSKSIGEEPYRRVVISSVNGRPERRSGEGRYDDRKGRGGYSGRGRYGRDRNDRKEYKPASMDIMKTSFEKDYKKPKPEDSFVSGNLYEKIDI